MIIKQEINPNLFELLFYKEVYGLFNFWRLLFLSIGHFSSKWIMYGFEIWPKSNISHAHVLQTINPLSFIAEEYSDLEKKIANYFSILALRTIWTVWKGKKIWHWKMNSPGQ